MQDTLLRLFRHKAWANDKLLTTLTSLGADSPVTALAIKALSHSYIVDRVFLAHMRHERHSYTSANASDLPSLGELSANIRGSDQEYVDYVSVLNRAQLAERIDFVFMDSDLGRMSREEMLMHVLTHGMGHRGQVSAAMLLYSIPPEKDGFTTYLHKTEASTRRRNAA